MKFRIKFIQSFVFISAILSTSTMAAKNDFLIKQNDTGATEYWTKARMENAKPFPMPLANPHGVREIPSNESTGKLSDSGDGSPPTTNLNLFQQLYTVKSLSKAGFNSSAGATLDHGGLNQQFSSSRLIPLSADVSYPYSAVGKLFFTTPKGDFVCSASVLRPRVILTAGHCVHSGSGGTSGFYSNWKFVPAFRDGSAPFGTWDWNLAAVTNTWANGGGSVPNAADYAMLEAKDNVIRDIPRTLGSVTGWLGWQTLSLIPNHAHLLGYPCNFDKCAKMHQVTAQSARQVSPNNVEYGSDMLGGSSGGPWVQNFGEYASGQTGGKNSGLNRVIGVTSYLYNDSSLMSEGSSIPDNRFVNLLNTVCAHRSGNC